MRLDRASALGRLLAELAQRRVRATPGPSTSGSPHAARDVVGDVVRERVGVEEFLPGGVLEGPFGTVFLHERLRSQIEPPRAPWGRYHVRPSRRFVLHGELDDLVGRGLEGAVFLDLETGGLANAPLFLAGAMHWNGTDFVIRQYFARDYSEEAALVDRLGEFLAGFRTVITYNGKSFDLPFLRDRATYHRQSIRVPDRHLDLLHHARRRWKGDFTDCRLVTLETQVCRRRRYGDVPSAEVPGLYHDFVKHGGAHRLVPVFHHNLLDVLTMDEILRSLIEEEWEEPSVPYLDGEEWPSASISGVEP